MGVTVTPSSYHSTVDKNQPNIEYTLNPRDKSSYNEFSTNFGASESTSSRRLMYGSKKHKVVKYEK